MGPRNIPSPRLTNPFCSKFSPQQAWECERRVTSHTKKQPVRAEGSAAQEWQDQIHWGPDTLSLSAPQIPPTLLLGSLWGPVQEPLRLPGLRPDQMLSPSPPPPGKEVRGLSCLVVSRVLGSHRTRTSKALIALPLATTRPSRWSQYSRLWDVAS